MGSSRGGSTSVAYVPSASAPAYTQAESGGSSASSSTVTSAVAKSIATSAEAQVQAQTQARQRSSGIISTFRRLMSRDAASGSAGKNKLGA